MQLIPAWAPNVHPMIVHFPIALVVIAVAADLIRIIRPRIEKLGFMSTALYVLGAVFAVSAYLSGRLAAEEVFVPGMAHPLVDDHRSWALWATVGFVLIAVIRLGVRLTRLADSRGARLLFAALGTAVLVLVQQTAERGARLVYEQGVGVIRGSVPAELEPQDPAGGG